MIHHLEGTKPFYSGLIDPHSSNVITGQVGPGSPSAFTYWIEPSGLYIIYCSRVGAVMGNSQNWIYNSAYDEFQAPVQQLMGPCLFLILTLISCTSSPAQPSPELLFAGTLSVVWKLRGESSAYLSIKQFKEQGVSLQTPWNMFNHRYKDRKKTKVLFKDWE